MKVGILGAAGIAHKNRDAICRIRGEDNVNDNAVGSGGGGSSREDDDTAATVTVSAIASRSLNKAKQFAEETAQQLAVGTNSNTTTAKIAVYGGGPKTKAYDDLLDDSSPDCCDAVYVPLPTALHAQFVGKALSGRQKHVLVEKPVALNAAEYQQLQEEAFQSNKFVMDGTFFIHHPRFRSVLDRCRVVDGEDGAEGNIGGIGTVRRIEAAFTFRADPAFLQTNIRCDPDADPLGCVGDLGWYCIRVALEVFSAQQQQQKDRNEALAFVRPLAVHAFDSTCNDRGVPIDATSLVYFEGDRKLVFHCGFLTPQRQKLSIIGSRKTIVMGT